MTDEFDPSEAAAMATNSLAEADGDDLADAASDEDTDATEEENTDDTGNSAVSVYLLPLLTASEAGPTSSTLRDYGIGGWVADVLDGAIDYILHFTDDIGDELDDSLGPAGKIGRGFYRRFGADEDSDAAEGQEGSDESSDGEVSPGDGL